MPRITIDLLRKRSEHNECVISTLEEISLHQEELEKIEVIGTLCRKLRILYLQNNIIEKIEDLTHMKELRYLNLALNNISKIEGLQSCEFLNKLDLTVNFIDFDTFEESIGHLKPLEHLRELYMLGNPCQSEWPEGFHEYVTAALPQLQLLDGKDIQRSDRIKALQVFPERLRYVREQAVWVRRAKQKRQEELDEQAEAKAQADDAAARMRGEEDVIDVTAGQATDISTSAKRPTISDDEKVPYTPHTRRTMYMELAEQKEEEEARRRENMPRERNTEAEHEQALRAARRVEQADDDGDRIRQCNEGKWDFRVMDEALEVIVEVDLPRFLDSSLVDVDVHPSYVSIVIKNKLFRLRFPELVHSDQGKAERSKVTGTLRLTLPKAHITPTQQLRATLNQKAGKPKGEDKRTGKTKPIGGGMNKTRPTRKVNNPNTKLSEEVMEVAMQTKATTKAVQLHGLVSDNQRDHHSPQSLPLTAISVKHKHLIDDEDEDTPPLLF